MIAAGILLGAAAVLGLVIFLVQQRRAGLKAEGQKRDLAGLQSQAGRMQDYHDGLPQSEGAVRASYDAGAAAMDACQWDEAVRHFGEGVKSASGSQLVALHNLAGLGHYAAGRWNDALAALEASHNAAADCRDKSGEAVALGNIGIVQKKKGEWDKALWYFEKALGLDRESGNRQGEAQDLGNIGVMWQETGEADKALRYHEQSLAIKRELGDRPGEADSLGNIGVAWVLEGEWDKAQESFGAALRIAKGVGDGQAQADNLGNIGVVSALRGEWNEALGHLLQARGVVLEAGAKPKSVQIHGNLARCLSVMGRGRFLAGCVSAGMAQADAEKLADQLAQEEQQPGGG